MSNLLIHEEPLIVLPGLAKAIGLNEAIFLQQVHYWLNKSKHQHDGYYWIYNTYDEWLKQFPFWSSATLRRIVNKLEKQGLLIKGNYNKLKIDQTKWYRIDYDLLDRMSRPSAQNEQMECSKRADEQLNMSRPLPETTTENTTKKVSSSNIFAFYENNFGILNSFIADSISQWVDETSEELVQAAMERALKQQKKWNYAEGILKQWANNNIKTLKDVEASEGEFKRNKGAKSNDPVASNGNVYFQKTEFDF
ncbi:TPA: DnaD domain protein [Bacillus cereus]|uniref:DnaD domain-containing protein n=1 Tax=Bacillus cereus group sp. BfR-BA-01700 TaxID=3094884 RepID=UPI0005343CE4|nr:DnaD domain protein [Bacillus cereus]HDR8514880.1 DnaD domain protein [Bacillus cereus]